MRGVNKVILIGNLGKDPEVRYLPSGGAVANATLATSETWRDKNTGQMQEQTEWHRVVFYGRLAEVVGEFLRKGSKVYVEGSLHTRKWQDKQTGQDRYSTEIKASNMQMLDTRGQGGGPDQGGDYSYGGGFEEHDQGSASHAAPSAPQQRPAQRQQQRAAGQQGRQPQRNSQRQAPARAAAGGPPADEFDDDIPF